MSSQCIIPPNPDISGVGVRPAIYFQNFVCFFPPILALWDGRVSSSELDSAETHSTTNLILAFAILISAMTQTRNGGLTNFHANIVLLLSWMNNTNAFVYFLLYVQRKSQPGKDQVAPEWRPWLAHIRGKLNIFAKPSERVVLSESEPSEKPEEPEEATYQRRSRIKAIFGRVVLVLGSLQLTLMASFGIWLWSNPRSFGQGENCAYDFASFSILGRTVPFKSEALRRISLVLYAAVLIPGFNLLLPALLFLTVYISHFKWLNKGYPPSVARAPAIRRTPLQTSLPWYKRLSRPKRQATPVFVGLLILLFINIIFIIDIELTIHRNRQFQTTEEEEWTFGQILALILLVSPLRDVIEGILSRQEKKMDKKRRDQLTQSLKGAVRVGAVSELERLVRQGADPNAAVPEGEPYATVLQLACLKGEWRAVRALLECGAHTGIRGGRYYTALQAACVSGSLETVASLLLYDPRVNSLGGHYGTALIAACVEGHHEIVKLLFDHGADLNEKGLMYGTALHAACYNGKSEIVERLLEKGSNPNVQGGQHPKGGTALHTALYNGHPELAPLLLKHDVDVKAQDDENDTALQLACGLDQFEAAKLLLERGADPNVAGGKYGPALYAASARGNYDLVKMLLDHGADPNIEGGEHGTPIKAAAFNFNDQILLLLLECGADPDKGGPMPQLTEFSDLTN